MNRLARNNNYSDLSISQQTLDVATSFQDKNPNYSANLLQQDSFQANTGDNLAFDLIGLTQLRNDRDFAGIDGSGFSVAIIDSGIDTDHPLLAENYLTGVDFINGDSIPDDVVGHGTHVAGTIGASDEKIGVAPDVGLIGLKVGEAQEVDYNAIVDSLEWVLDNYEEYNITAVNMSLSGGFYTSEDQIIGDRRLSLVQQLEDLGIVVVAAAGNLYGYKDVAETEPNQEPNLGAPAIYSTLAVGAVWQDDNAPSYYASSNQIPGTDRVAYFSQRLNADNFLFAPGTYINSTYTDNDGLELLSGTSMASPHVAGTVALLQEAALQFGGRVLTPDEVVTIFRETADPVFDGDDEADLVTNTDTSYSRINIYNAVVEVQQRFVDIAPTPNPDEEEENLSGDSNGTIAGAFIGPSLDGSESPLINSTIGIDGNGAVIGDRDVDLFRFLVESPGNVTIQLGSHTTIPEDFDTYLRLFDGDGNELAANNDSETESSPFSVIETFLEPGTYYAGVSGYNNSDYNPNVADSGVTGATGNYSIQFSLDNLDPNGLISGAREVSLGSDREPLVFPSSIGSDYGKPLNVSDVDLYQITVPDNGILLIDIDTPYEDEYVDSYLRLFNEQGEELVFTDTDELVVNDNNLSFNINEETTEYVDPDFPDLVFESSSDRSLKDGKRDNEGNYLKGNYGHETDSFIGVLVNRGDIYLIGVSDSSNQNYDPTNLNNRLETTNGGLYELVVTFANNDLNGTITQLETETANSPFFSSRENIGKDAEREIGDRDVDFWKINSEEAGILEINIDGNSEDAANPSDTVASLFDGEGNRLAINDDTDGLDPLLRYQIAADTDYYVSVTGYGNENFDPFALGSGSGGDTGEYTINSTRLPLSELNNLTNNSFEQAGIGSIEIGEIINGNVGEDNGLVLGADDIDLYRLEIPTQKTVNVRVSTLEEFSADTVLRLFDAEGNEIAFNNDENSLTRGSYLQQELAANTEYYIGINGNSDRPRAYDPITGENAVSGSQGDYGLSVSYEGDLNALDTTIYRFQNTAIPGTYIYVGESERQKIQQNLPGFREEGLAFKVAALQADGLIPIYRFQNKTIPGTYLYVGETERESINRDFSNSFTEEGLAFYVFGANEGEGRTLYRFQNSAQPGTYIFVAEAERTNILENFPSFVEEGIAFEVAT
jgi:Subtilase family/Bacterial pre-peptidase C-terminal domain